MNAVDYGGVYNHNANMYFMMDGTERDARNMITLIREHPMNIFELMDALGMSRKRLEHLIDTATLLYGNIWEESRRVKWHGKIREMVYYAAE